MRVCHGPPNLLISSPHQPRTVSWTIPPEKKAWILKHSISWNDSHSTPVFIMCPLDWISFDCFVFHLRPGHFCACESNLASLGTRICVQPPQIKTTRSGLGLSGCACQSKCHLLNQQIPGKYYFNTYARAPWRNRESRLSAILWCERP